MSASMKRQATASPTRVPDNLNHMSQPELVALVRCLASERDDLRNQVGSQKKLKPSPALTIETLAAHSAVSAAAPLVTPVSSAAMQKRLGKAAVKAIKQNVYGGTKKPTSVVSEGNVSIEMVKALMADFPPKSDTKRMTKWQLSCGKAIPDLLSCDRLVHPVKHNGKGFICFGKIYGWAGYDSMEVKYDKNEMLLTLTIRTYYAGSGPPDISPHLLAYSKRQVDVLVDRW